MRNNRNFNDGYWCCIQEVAAQYISIDEPLIISLLSIANFSREEYKRMMNDSPYKRDELLPLVNELLEEKGEKILIFDCTRNNKIKYKLRRITAGHYFYRGLEVRNVGYYSPDHKVCWEAIDTDGIGFAHSFKLKDTIKLIDKDKGDE